MMTFNEYVDREGMKFIYYLLNKKYIQYEKFITSKGLERDDFYNYVILKLIEDWNSFDEERGKVTTFISLKINAFTLHFFNHYNAKKRDINTESILYLDKQVDNDNDNTNSDIICLKNDDDDDEIKLLNIITHKLRKIKRKGKNIEIFIMYLHDYSPKEIAATKGYNVTHVRNVIKNERDIIRKYYTPQNLFL